MTSRFTATAIALVHGLIGWTLCGATMGVAMSITTLKSALLIHAVAVPVIFVAVSIVYFHYFETPPPLLVAAQFVSVVIALDLLVVAMIVERSFRMFASPLGAWLPFVSIFVATWWTGVVMHRVKGVHAARG